MANRNDYYITPRFAVDEYGLKGNELVAFSVIYSFTHDGEHWFTGSAKYIADWCNATKRSVLSSLASLMDKGYLIRNQECNNGVTFNSYRAVIPKWVSQGNNFTTDENFSSGAVKFFQGGDENFSPNNIDNNKRDNKDISHGKSKSLPPVDKDSNEYALAKYLFDGIHTNFPNIHVKESDIDRWARDIEKIHRIDGYDWQTIADVTEFALTDPFWQQNIRSGAKLREKFDTLLIRKEAYAKRNS